MTEHKRIGEKTRTVLVLDDDEINLMILCKGVQEMGFTPKSFLASDEAWQYMLAHGAEIDIAVLDKMMPGMDGIEMLKRIKNTPSLQHIPVIIQTGDVGVEQMREGLQAGAYYYLTKPFHPTILAALLQSAAQECDTRENLAEQMEEGPSILPLLREGEFVLKTHAEARELCAAFSKSAVYPEFAATGLMELLANAIEHGNLGIGFDRKRECLLAQSWEQELEARAGSAEYARRGVHVHMEKTLGSIYLIITDEGAGFDWHHGVYDDVSVLRLNEPNGRGIAKASVMLDDIRYVGKGNEVHCTIHLQPEANTHEAGGTPHVAAWRHV